MKHFIAIAALLGMTAVASAQTTVSGATSGSVANNTNINASLSAAQGGSVIIPTNPAKTKSDIDYGGTYTINSAPAVSAPAVFGGGHPCLAGKSGGLSVIGGGFSYGQGNPEPACMAWIMGQPEIALSVMFNSDPKFKAAACSVGFWRVGGKTIPVKCNKRTASASSKSVAPTAMKVKCVGNVPHVTAKVAKAYSREQLVAACR